METTSDCTPQFHELSKIVNEVDPINLISRGCPDDEYDLEVELILELIPSSKSLHQLAEMVQDIFIKSFNDDQAGLYPNCYKIAELIWINKEMFPTPLYEWLKVLISGGIKLNLIPRLKPQKLPASMWEIHTQTENEFEQSEATWGDEKRDRLLMALLYRIGLEYFVTILPAETKQILSKLIKNTE